MKKVLILLALTIFYLVACGKSFEQMSAREIYDYGEKKFAKKRYSAALEAYQALIDLYPFSMYATESELRIADSHFKKRQWAEAVSSYEAFLERHPTHPKIPRVIQNLGMSNYKQKLAIDRDQHATSESLRYFSKLAREYPDSTETKESAVYLSKLKDELAKRERYIARFYWRDNEYYSSLERYLNIARLYPESRYYEEAIYYAGLCYVKLDEAKNAKRQFNLLVEKFPNGRYANRAKEALNKLKNATDTNPTKH